MTTDADNEQKKPPSVSRREALRAGLIGTAIMLPVSSSGASDARPSIPAGNPDELSRGVKIGPGLRQYVGTNITVFWRGKLCIHARYCVTGAPEVFTPDARWDLSKESADLIAHVIRQCPSGALTYKRTDGEPQEVAPRVNVIRIYENGPLAVHADLGLPGAEPMKRATLCRCGSSNNKPFCDGSHNTTGFVSTGEVVSTKNVEKLDNRGGRLQITPVRNGPYQVSGNVEICAATGRVVARAAEATLCRCGHTGTAPFCDGSHVTSHFIAEGT